MTPEQIAAFTKDKSGNAVCTTVIGAGFTANSLIVGLDQNVIKNGGMTVKCGEQTVTFDTQLPVKAVTPVPVVVVPAPTK